MREHVDPRVAGELRGGVVEGMRGDLEKPHRRERYHEGFSASARRSGYFGKGENTIATQRKVNARTIAPRFLRGRDRRGAAHGVRSRTRPFADGLVLRIFDDRPADAEPIREKSLKATQPMRAISEDEVGDTLPPADKQKIERLPTEPPKDDKLATATTDPGLKPLSEADIKAAEARRAEKADGAGHALGVLASAVGEACRRINRAAGVRGARSHPRAGQAEARLDGGRRRACGGRGRGPGC